MRKKKKLTKTHYLKNLLIFENHNIKIDLLETNNQKMEFVLAIFKPTLKFDRTKTQLTLGENQEQL